MLDLPAQLNMDANRLAGSYIHLSNIGYLQLLLITGTAAQLFIQGSIVTSNYATIIRTTASLPTIQQHILKKDRWTWPEFNMVDWDSNSDSIQKLISIKRFLSKLLHNWLPL